MQRDDDATPKRRRDAFLQSSLQSLARVAERGASKWGDYVTTSTKGKTSSLKRSSSLYISQLHQKIQKDGQTIISSSDLKRKIDRIQEGTVPQEHFTEEILAYMLGGAAAGSAFAAATTVAFVGTAVMALGAIVTVLITDEEEQLVYSLMDEEASEYGQNSNGKQTVGIEGCDYNGEDQEVQVDHERLSATKKSPTDTLDSFMLEELKKCYNGNPDTKLDFSRRRSKDICIVDRGDSSTLDDTIIETEEVSSVVNADEHVHGGLNDANLDLASAIEDACGATEDCNHLMPTVEDAAPKRVEVVWHDTYAGAYNAHYFTNTQSTNEIRQKLSQQRRASSEPRTNVGTPRTAKQSNDEHWAILTDGEREGALLLSESFRVVSSAFGLVADAVRFTGETAAATAGGASRIAGGVVRLSGWAVGSLGEAIECGGNERDENGDQTLASSKVSTSDNEKVRKRQVAGTSVRLIGDAIEQVADSLLLAGSATERVAFATAGAAEGTVRIVEDFASSLSDLFLKEGRRGSDALPASFEKESDEVTSVIDEKIRPNVAEEGAVNAEDMNNTEEPNPNGVIQSKDETVDLALIGWLRSLSSLVVQNTDILIAETAGVPSLAPEMLGVFLMCFLASIFVLSSKKNKGCLPDGQITPIEIIDVCSLREEDGRPIEISFQDIMHTTSPKDNAIEGHDSQSTLTVESTMKTGPPCVEGCVDFSLTSLAKRVTEPFLFFILMPTKLARVILVRSLNIALSKEALLLVVYTIGWIFLSRVSQYKSSVIQRKSELVGYNMAIQSIGKSSLSITESAVWLNTILYQLWRGLEPLLSSSASASLAESLESPYSKPSVVAYVALEAFTFGSSPPIVSRIEMKGVDDDQSVIFMDVDIGILLQDAVLLLDIKPSSLEYRSLPSTKVSINSLDAKATLSISVKCSPDYPYVSFLNISLAGIPDFNLRIEPQSESGLKGIDFGSFPIVSQWIKSSINSALAGYLSPQYISIDVLAWLKGDDKIATYFGID